METRFDFETKTDWTFNPCSIEGGGEEEEEKAEEEKKGSILKPKLAETLILVA